MIIRKIFIKNFRSIESCKIDAGEISVFSGCNDSGKSNLLKALNLFFNNKTDHGVEFDFDNDFCHFATVPNKTAPEIRIEITLTPPSHYSDPSDFVWRKKWRKGVKEEFESKMYLPPSPSNEVSNSSKNWARKIRYRYVPAMKSDDYFSQLLRDLHNTLAISIDEELKRASENFLSTITSHTVPMVEELNHRLNLGSSIRLPEDLSSLFEVLDFGTTHNGSDVSINRRGDGVKIRHIPSVLKFLHEEENRVRKKGSVKVNTIWGYEEPENNLEYLSAFSKSEEFFEISREIQMFLSTHSPAFYNLKKKSEDVKLFYTTQGGQGTDYAYISNNSDVAIADEQMGLLPIVAPYVEEKEKELQVVRRSISEMQQRQTHASHTIFVEGNSDKKIIEYVLDEILDCGFKVEVRSDSSAGSSWVRNNLIAWAMNPLVESSEFKAFGLLDNDDAGKKDHDLFNEYMKYVGRRAHERKVKSHKLFPSIYLRSVLSEKGFSLGFAIEELFPPHIWEYADEQGWLEERKLVDCCSLKDLPNNKTLFEVVEERFCGKEEIIYLFKKVANRYKGEFSRYVVERGREEPGIFDGVEANVKSALDFFRR